MKIYHGSKDLVYNPQYELGKPINDFGKGFYCTNDIEKAKEWACKNKTNGYVNEYEIDIKDLKVLDLTNKKYNVLNWISILLKNRVFDIENQISIQSREFLINNYYVDTNKYDIVIGYRADDSYFSYAQSFIDNSLSVESLTKAMQLGNLGTQIVLVSKKAFQKIKFVKYISVDKKIYYIKFKQNDRKARNDYKKIMSNTNETFIFDIIRKEKRK